MTSYKLCRQAAACLLFGAGAHGAWAQLDPAALIRQNDVLERQRQELLKADQERALRAAPRQPGVDPDSIRPQVSVPDLGVPCRDIRVISVNNAPHLPQQVVADVEREFVGRCLGVSDLEAALAKITKSYIDRGFITTRAYLPAQDLKSGTLEIAVIEGTIEDFKLKSDRPTSVWPRGAFPVQPGDLLSLRDLEQGIDQINRLGSNRAVLDIEPGSQPGQSVVVVQNPSVTPINLFASFDNYGVEATGRRNASATVSLDSALGLNELISVTHRESVPHDGDHNSVANAALFSIPFGYSLFTLDTSSSKYGNRVSLPSGSTIMSNGDTVTHGATLDHVVFRDQTSRVSLAGRLTTQDTRNYVEDQFLGVASRKLAYVDLAVNALTAVAGGSGNARLAYVKGLSDFGALKDPDDLPDDLPHAQFRKVTLDLGFNRSFALTASQPLLWSSVFSSQYSYDTLYGSQQFLVGGVSSIRGSSNNTLSGDNGWLWRNEVSLPWQGREDAAGVNGRLYLAYDFGKVSNRAPGVPSGSMSGLALGTTLAWKGVAADLFVARTLHLPSFMSSESTQFGLRLSYSL